MAYQVQSRTDVSLIVSYKIFSLQFHELNFLDFVQQAKTTLICDL